MNGSIAAATLVTLAASALAQDCSWEAFGAPNRPGGGEMLLDVDGIAGDDVWAVGRYQGDDTETYAIHFDGVEWTLTPTPNPSGPFGWSWLGGVLALGPDDAIAVGHYDPGGAGQAMAMRWDGSEWSEINAPFTTGGSSFEEVEKIGDDIWGVGRLSRQIDPPASFSIGMAARWNGSTWEQEFVPPLAALGGRSYNVLNAIDGATTDDLWAVGVAQQTGSTDPFGPRTYMVHFDGSEWSLVDQDFGHPNTSAFSDVVAIAPDDVWVVGHTFTSEYSTQPLIIHYDGSGWTQVDLPPFTPGFASLRAVTARSSDEIYAMGSWPDENGVPRDLILRYDGQTWEQMDAQNHLHQQFWGATTLPNGDVWTVGTLASTPTTERLSCGPIDCPADLDGDGDADADDFFAYLDLFAADDPASDLDGDGDTDADDFFQYLDLFASGC